MGVTSYTQEITCPIPAARLFKAMILDGHNLLPKLVPQSIKSIDVEGDGGPGTTKQINFAEGSHFKFMKQRVDAIDKEKFEYKYTVIEGDVIGEKVSKIVYHVKFEDCGDGKCVCKTTTECHGVGDFEIKEEEIKAGKDKASGLQKVVEAYLLENPDAYV